MRDAALEEAAQATGDAVFDAAIPVGPVPMPMVVEVRDDGGSMIRVCGVGTNGPELARIHDRDRAWARRVAEELVSRWNRVSEAEGNARILAHAYQTDSRPPEKVVRESLAYDAGRGAASVQS